MEMKSSLGPASQLPVRQPADTGVWMTMTSKMKTNFDKEYFSVKFLPAK